MKPCQEPRHEAETADVLLTALAADASLLVCLPAMSPSSSSTL